MNDTAATANAEQVPFLQEKTILATAGIVLVLDQLTKWITVATLKVGEKVVVINGFFDFVHWRNPGAAWSILEGQSFFLAIVSIFALWALIHFREHFEIGTRTGKLAMGAMIGGIIGNCIDRLAYQEVVDFLKFYVVVDGKEKVYPAFNIADMGICIGVGLMFVMAWRKTEEEEEDSKEGPA